MSFFYPKHGTKPSEQPRFVMPPTLAILRFWQGLSQVAVARRVGIGKSYLSQIESGQRVPPEWIRRRLARVLGVPESRLFPGASRGKGKEARSQLNRGRRLVREVG